MLDDAFTYGGWACSLVVKGFEDELQLGASCEERARNARWHQVRQAAVALTAVAALCLSIGFAIPD
jgi:hypothetical protein